MIVTMQRWKYNNNDMQIRKASEKEVKTVSGSCASEIMPVIREIWENSDCFRFTPWDIIDIQD